MSHLVIMLIMPVKTVFWERANLILVMNHSKRPMEIYISCIIIFGNNCIRKLHLNTVNEFVIQHTKSNSNFFKLFLITQVISEKILDHRWLISVPCCPIVRNVRLVVPLFNEFICQQWPNYHLLKILLGYLAN